MRCARLSKGIGPPRPLPAAWGRSNCQSVWARGPWPGRVLGDDHGPASGDGKSAHWRLVPSAAWGNGTRNGGGACQDGQLY